MAIPRVANALSLLGGTPAPTPEPSGLMRFAEALQGLGAGFQGKGAQFLAAKEARLGREDKRREKLSRERLQAAAIDARVTGDFLRAGDMRSALTLIDNRIESIGQLGGDPSDTVALRERIAAGDVAGALADVERVDQIATLAGLVEAAPQAARAQVLKSGDVSESGQVFERSPDGTIRARQIEGFQAAPTEAPKPLSGIGRLRQDFREGRITEEDFRAGLGKASGLKSGAQIEQEVDIAKRIQDIQAGSEKSRAELAVLEQKIDAGEAKAADTVAKRERGNEVRQNAIDTIDKLLADPDSVRAVVGPIDQVTPTLLPGSGTAAGRIETLRNLLTVENLGLMSGVLSESDIKILANVGSGGLILGGDDDTFLSELGQLRDALKAKAEGAATVGAAPLPPGPNVEQPVPGAVSAPLTFDPASGMLR